MTCSCRQAAPHPGSATHAPGVQTGGYVSEWFAGKVFREVMTVAALTSPVWLVMLLTSRK